MPLIDMPLEELRKYNGRNPCPSDMDQYWESALAEMHATDSRIELIPAEFQVPFADCFDLYFTGVKGARIHVKYIKPKTTEESHPAVIQFHGYSGNSGDWHDKLGYAATGLSVFAMDCRGQGGSSEDKGGVTGNTYRGHIIRGLDDCSDNLLFRHIFLDAAQLATIVMNLPETDENKVAVMGGSQGGALALVCGCLEPRIKKIASAYPFLSDYKRVWEMDLAERSYEELKIYFRLFDPLHQREDEIFKKLGYIDVQHLAKRIQGDVLFAVGLMDTVCPPSTQFAIYNKITARKEMVIYPDFGHEVLPGFWDRAYRFITDF